MHTLCLHTSISASMNIFLMAIPTVFLCSFIYPRVIAQCPLLPANTSAPPALPPLSISRRQQFSEIILEKNAPLMRFSFNSGKTLTEKFTGAVYEFGCQIFVGHSQSHSAVRQECNFLSAFACDILGIHPLIFHNLISHPTLVIS